MSIILRVSNGLNPRRHSLAALLLAPWLAVAFAHPAAGQGLPGSTAVLEWEAPGDDGSSGTAARYEVRYQVAPIVGSDTLSWWNAGTIVGGLPTPGPSGTTDSVVVSGLDPSVSYYFVLRVADEVPNWSGFSNVVIKPAFADLIPPATIRDLEANSGNNLRAADRAISDPTAAPPRR
jgi:hypothetical protein